MRVSVKASRIVAVVLLILAILPAGTSAQFPKIDAFFVFGDSFADNGNVWIATTALGQNPAPPPSTSPHRTYFNGRFSNGPVAFEYLWQSLSGIAPGQNGSLRPFLAFPFLGTKDAVNFAFGGTGTPPIDLTPAGLPAPGLLGQVELFRVALRGRRPSRHALYAIVTGSNDYRDDPFNVPMHPAVVVQNIVDAVRKLYNLGARNVIVVNVPDFRLIPGIPQDPDPGVVSDTHNFLLAQALAALGAELPQLNLIPIRVEDVVAQLPSAMNIEVPALDAIFNPSQFPPGFTMSACLFINPATCVDVPSFDPEDLGLGRYLFWDLVHPTTDAHGILGGYIYDALLD